jgi:hypothetical protein
LEIEPCFQGFLYIESLEALSEHADAVIEAVIRTFAPFGLIAAPLELVKNWEQIRFVQIPYSEIVFRDQAWKVRV